DTDESTIWGISYAVNDSFSIAYNVSEFDLGSSTTDQESDGISASYTMGGITVAGAMNSTDNIAGSTATTADKDAYEMSISFAF
ncbi:porin, partial [Candidatus Pelagibacter bacterium]|nr:porin [Candidatus Pelagibacter bacterium]